MTAQHSEAAPSFAGPAYGVGLLFVLFPLVDVVVQAWPIQAGSPTWRYGAVGIGANYLVSVVFGMALLCYTAARSPHRRALIVLAILAVLMALVDAVAVVGFVLDGLQIRPSIPTEPPRARWMFEAGMEKALFKYVAGGLVLLWVALASRRALKAMPGRSDAPKLVRETK